MEPVAGVWAEDAAAEGGAVVGGAGQRLILVAGVPFKTPGSTNVLHIVRLVGDELDRHEASRKG